MASFKLSFKVLLLLFSIFPLISWAYPSHDTSYPDPGADMDANHTSKDDPTSTTNNAASVTTHRRLPYSLYTHLASVNTHNGSPTNSNTMSNGAKAGIGIGISLILLAIITAVLIQRHKKKERQRLRSRYRSMENWAAAQNEMAFRNDLASPRERWDIDEEERRIRRPELSSTNRPEPSPTGASSSTTPASSVKHGRESNIGLERQAPNMTEMPKAVINGANTTKERSHSFPVP